MTICRLLTALILCIALLRAQPLSSAKLLKPTVDVWPIYNGDYSGRRHSPLKQIDASNVKSLALAWAYRANPGAGSTVVPIKATPLEVNGVLYFTLPDHAWAVDARSGKELWHFKWETKGGFHIGNRGFGMYGNWLYLETPDCYLVSLDARTGKMRW